MDLSSIPEDVFANIITDYLDVTPMNYYSILKSSKQLNYRTIKKLFDMVEKNIKYNFTNSDTLYEEAKNLNWLQSFLETLPSCGAIVTGGFVLQAFYGETWKHSDMDVYCHTSKLPKLIQSVLDSYKGRDKPDYCIQLTPDYHNSFMKRNSIEYLVTFMGSGYSFLGLQLIAVKDDVPLSHVVSTFDLNICQVTYDGLNVELFGITLDDLEVKRGSLNPDYYQMFNFKLIKRIVKYRERGFNIQCDVSKGLKLLYSKKQMSIHEQLNECIINSLRKYNWFRSKKEKVPQNIHEYFSNPTEILNYSGLEMYKSFAQYLKDGKLFDRILKVFHAEDKKKDIVSKFKKIGPKSCPNRH